MKKSIALEIISFLLILLFVYTGVSKFIHFDNFKYVLNRTPGFRPYSNIMAVALPVTELVAAVLLISARFRKWGLYISSVLMTAFTCFVIYVLFISPHIPCTCGGIIRQMSWKQHLVFNALFTIAAFVGIWLQKQQHMDNKELLEIKFA